MSAGTSGTVVDPPSGVTKRAPLAILLVEDNPDDALLVKEGLSEAGSPFEVHHAEALSDGVVRLSQRLFDAVLLDLYLPDSDGAESVHDLRERFPDVPIVVLTGRDDESVAASALEHGAQDYIVKGSAAASSLGRSLLYAMRRQRVEARRKRESALEVQGKKLQSLGLLASGIAHDFNNVLMGILGNIALLREELASSERELGRLREIESGALRAADMTAQLLAYAGRGEIARRELSLNELVRDTEDLVRPLLPGGVRLVRQFGEGLPDILGDATQIRQLVMNLLLNAADAVEDGTGEVKLHTGLSELTETDLRACQRDTGVGPGAFVYLEVRDDGCGMDPETQARMFDPFFTTKAEGRGLGLASTLGTVTRHRGALSVSSALTEGTSIRVFFPATEGAGDDPGPEGPRAVPHASPAATTVLVVEDEVPVRRYVVAALRNAGFRTLAAPDGVRAIELLDAHVADVAVALIDWRLPGGRGDEVLERLRAVRPGLPAVIMSGVDDREPKLRHTTTFLQKPFAPRRLLDVLRALLTSSGGQTP